MINVGSISDQTLAGIVTTATHGSGINYGVMSTNVQALKLLLADGRVTRCSKTEEPDLFNATLCGLGTTGILLEVLLDVEHAFRLKEVQEPLSFDAMIRGMDHLVRSAQHVRFWWFPAVDQVICSSADRTYDVSLILISCDSPLQCLTQVPKPAGSWFWNTFLGFHFVQLILFLGRYFHFLNIWAQYLNFWLVSKKSVGIDDSYRIFNVDCKVGSAFDRALHLHWAYGRIQNSIRNLLQNGQSHMPVHKPVFKSCILGSDRSLQIGKDWDLISPSRSDFLLQMTSGWAQVVVSSLVGSVQPSTSEPATE